MKYISTGTWRDLTDGHLYHEGEPFPFDGREVAPERITELETAQNRAGFALIRAEDVADEGAEAPKEEAPDKAPEEAPEEAKKTAAKKAAPRKTTTKKPAKK